MKKKKKKEHTLDRTVRDQRVKVTARSSLMLHISGIGRAKENAYQIIKNTVRCTGQKLLAR